MLNIIKKLRYRLKLYNSQKKVNNLLKSLPDVLRADEMIDKSDGLIRWFSMFGEEAAWKGIVYDKKKLAKQLEQFGYIKNFGVGESENFFKFKENKARYIIGQFINGLKTVGCWPDILIHWCKEHENI